MKTAQRRILAANIPPRLRGASLEPGEPRYVRVSISGGGYDRWRAAVSDDKVLRAVGEYETCGKGIWAVGERSTAFQTALMRDLLMERDGASGLYLGIDAYLDAMRPDSADESIKDRARSVDFLVLANVGVEHMTDWTKATTRSLLLSRFDDGLPTLVSSTRSSQDYLPPSLAREVFVHIEIMDAS